jgi:hypothetical protein
MISAEIAAALIVLACFSISFGLILFGNVIEKPFLIVFGLAWMFILLILGFVSLVGDVKTILMNKDKTLEKENITRKNVKEKDVEGENPESFTKLSSQTVNERIFYVNCYNQVGDTDKKCK